MKRTPETDNLLARRHVTVGSGYPTISHISFVSCPTLLTVVDAKIERNLGGAATQNLKIL